MQPRLAPLLAMMAALAFPAYAINMELSRLVAQDQEDRRATQNLNPQSAKAASLADRDFARRTAVLRMLAEGSIQEPIDYENAALIFLHGVSPEEYRLAHALATIAAAIEPNRSGAKQLKRLSWDRFMLSIGRNQWYGSQSVYGHSTGARTYPRNDPTVTDKQRLAAETGPIPARQPPR